VLSVFMLVTNHPSVSLSYHTDGMLDVQATYPRLCESRSVLYILRRSKGVVRTMYNGPWRKGLV
jgi:hypothetical protein